jgi:Uma2 family endonuclease
MSTTLPENQIEPVLPTGLGSELRIRLADSVEEMRARFDDFVAQNPDLNVEQEPSGEIVIMAPTGAEGSSANSEITYQLVSWCHVAGGKTFDSSCMFVLANGAKRSPDAAWITDKRWQTIPPAERKKFPRIAPDFVIELRSDTDRLSVLQSKLQEYIDNGVRLGWLIDPLEKRVHIYSSDKQPVVLENPQVVSGGDMLQGFELHLERIFQNLRSQI